MQISSIYGNAMKDRLYCEAAISPLRRRCQTVMQRMADRLTKLLAPMLVFTADEVWEHHPPQAGRRSGAWPACIWPCCRRRPAPSRSEAQQREWELLMELRDRRCSNSTALKKEVGLNKALGCGDRLSYRR